MPPFQLAPIDIASVCHEANRAYCLALGDTSQLPWNEAAEWQRCSALSGVENALRNNGVTPELQHEKWRQDKLADGWTYGETKDEALKMHPCLVAYDALPEAQRRKDLLFLSIVRALS